MIERRDIGFLYINGLGSGRTTMREVLMRWWWRRAGIDLRLAHVNWFDQRDLSEKIHEVQLRVDRLLEDHSGVAIIGCSAGGSLAVNVFQRLKKKNICAVVAHGRLQAGPYSSEQAVSLYNRAKMHTNHPSQSFFDSVIQAETFTIPGLSNPDKWKLLTLTQLTDGVVPTECMRISGVQNHRAFAFGHFGGFVAHLFGDRNLIIRFATNVLADKA